jgi:hypothetical protein
LGLVVGDDMVNQFLQQETFNRVRPADLERIVASYRLPSGQRVSSQQIFDALREELLSIQVVLLFLNGLGRGNEHYLHPLDTPAERWDYFRRLERQATAQVLAVPVAEFTEEVGKPSEDQLTQLFEKYKQQFPSPDSPEPGFRQPYRAKFQYFKVDGDELINAEMKNISEEEVREYYEKNKDKEFKKLTLPPLDKNEDKSKAEQETEKSESTKEGNAPAAAEGKDKPANENTEQKTDQKSGEKPDAAEPKPQPSANTGVKPVEDAKEKSTENKESKAAADKSAQARPSSPFRFVYLQDEGSKAKEIAAETDQAQSKKEPKTQPATDAATDKAADEAAGKTETKPATRKEEAPSGKSTDAETPVNENTAKDESAGNEAAKEFAEEKPTPPAPVEYRPLEQVQEEIRRTLARQIVQKQVDERLDKLREEMNSYSRVMASHRRAVAKNPNEPKPKPFALESLAEKYGAKAFTTEFISRLDAQTNEKLDIGKSRDMGLRSSTFFQQWTQIAFQPKGLLRPITTKDAASEASFLSWKIDEREGNIPDFTAVRGEVLEAWKRIQARDLAVKKAKEYAEMVRKAKQPMKEVFAKEMDLPVSEVGPFSWLTRPSVPLGMQGMQQMPPSQYPQIPGVANPGEEFMETTFGLQAGEVGVALNHPKSIAYVIDVVKFEPSNAVLEQEFMVKVREYERYRDAGRVKAAEAQNDWMDSMLAEYDVQWQRPPALRLAANE